SDCLRMEGVSGVAQCDERVHIQKISHGKSDSAARTSSLVTLIPRGDLVTRSPVLLSLMSRPVAFTGCCGVSRMESPCTSHFSLAPGRKCNWDRACFGRTTWPLLESVVV